MPDFPYLENSLYILYIIVIMYYTRLEVDRVKPWISVRINLGLGSRGPDIRPDNRHLSRVEVDRVKPWNSVRIFKLSLKRS